jgi:hypothetical protein
MCTCSQLLEVLAAAFAQCTLPQHTSDSPPTVTSSNTATTSTVYNSDDGTATDVETQRSSISSNSNSIDAQYSISSSNSSSIDAQYSANGTQHSADAPVIQVKPETARVSVDCCADSLQS